MFLDLSHLGRVDRTTRFSALREDSRCHFEAVGDPMVSFGLCQ